MTVTLTVCYSLCSLLWSTGQETNC